MSVIGGGGGGRQVMAPVVGSKFYFYQNELKSPKIQHVFLYFFLLRVGGWVSDP